MAPYHIRKYQERDDKSVRDVFYKAMVEHASTTFYHVLKLPQTHLLLLGVPLTLFLLSASWILTLLASLTLLAALWFLVKYPWVQFVTMSLKTDMSDITKNYFSQRGSCFWVAESDGQVVGIVGALPVKELGLREKQLKLFHMCVSSEYRGQGIAKALVRTVLQFGQDQGYSAVVLSTSMLQYSALGLYQSMGFQKTHHFFYSLTMRLAGIYVIQFKYSFLPAQDQSC